MFSTILVPLDGSHTAERALGLAANLARRLSARVVLVRSVQPSRPATPDDHSEARRYLDAQVSGLGAQGLIAEADVPEGEAAAQILHAVQTCGADLIVMSTHGQGKHGRWLVGSVAAEVLRGADVPVGLVSAGTTPTLVGDKRPTIFVPLDGSEFGEAALGPATQLAAQLAARVVLFRSVSPPASVRATTGMDVETEAMLWQAREYLTEIARRVSPTVRHLAVRTAIGYPSVAIPRASLETDSDFITLATHGLDDAPRIALGSVATAVLRQITIPLLLVRPDRLAERREAHADDLTLANDCHSGAPPGESRTTLNDLVAI